ncbi:MAG TPA: hypothetical protein VME18_11740 [Acidobacteriaceae bacterium]|nr:hypothetical protein [Acidobacteriaceae bacterium]
MRSLIEPMADVTAKSGCGRKIGVRSEREGNLTYQSQGARSEAAQEDPIDYVSSPATTVNVAG